MSWLDTLIFGYRNVQAAGVSLPAENTLNFTGAVTIVDNPGLQRTDVTFTALTSPSGTGLIHVTSGTVDATAYKGAAGQFLVTNAGGTDTAWVNMSQDGTLSGTGALAIVQLTGNGSSVVNIPNVATWKMTSLAPNIGDVLKVTTSSITLGNTTGTNLTIVEIDSQNIVVVRTGVGTSYFNVLAGTGSTGGVYMDATIQRFRDTAGNEAFRFDLNNPSLNIDSGSGTFPATGLFRSKTYGGAQALWTGKNAGGDASIIKHAGAGSLTFGDDNAVSGWTTIVSGFTLTLQNPNLASWFSVSSTDAIRFAEYTTGRKNFGFTLTSAVAGAAQFTFGEAIIPTIKQDTATTATNGQTFNIVAQAAKVGGGGNGGTLALASGAKDGAGSDGTITVSIGAAQQVSISPFNWTFVGSTVLGSGGNLTLGSTSVGFTSFQGSGAVSAVYSNTTGYFSVGTTAQDLLRFTQTNAGAGAVTFDTASTSLTIKQSDKVTNSGTGAALTIQAQNETGTTSTGGDLLLKQGTGTTTDGTVGIGTAFGKLSFIGSQKTTQRAISGNLTVDTTTTDYEILVDTAAARTITLPPPTAGRKLLIKDKTGSAGTNNITIARNASEKIEGTAASYLINWNWGWVELTSDGTDWFVYS